MKKNRPILILTVVLLIVAGYFLFSKTSGTILEELKDFAIDDTSSINKIFLTDKNGTSALLEKHQPGNWTVNKKYSARNDAINTLMATMKNMDVRSPVAKAAYNVILKQMASKSIKTEIYQNDMLVKTYYVGGPTQDQLGTYMFMENSSVPFVIHIPGFNGYLTPRYIASEKDWKFRKVFDKKPDEIASLTYEDNEKPANSFIITQQTSGQFILASYPDMIPLENTEQNKIMNYLSNFSFINYEGEARLTKQAADSLKNAGPFRILTLKDKQNAVTKVKIFHMPLSETDQEIFNSQDSARLPHDNDRMLALINQDTAFIVIQNYVFDKLFVQPEAFKNQEKIKM